MIWINRFKSRVWYFLAIQLRKAAQRRTASALAQLDDRSLAIIGVPRHRIMEYAREVAHASVSVPPKPPSAQEGILERLRSWQKWRATIRDLSALDDRLLRDIGIEPDQIEDVVKAAMSHRRDLDTASPVVLFSGATQRTLVPARHRPRVRATSVSKSRSPLNSGSHTTFVVERMCDARVLQSQAANASEPPERRQQAAADK